MSSEARPSSLAVRTAASIAALAVGAIGVVGFASAATAANEVCVPAEAVTHTEHTYARTITLWATTSPGDEWSTTGKDRTLVAAVLEYEARRWDWKPRTGGDLKTDENIGDPAYGSWDYKWFSHSHDSTGNGRDWTSTGKTQIKEPAVVEYEYSKAESTIWLTGSPGSEWTVVDTRVVTDSEAVVCAVTASLTANGYRFRPGDTIDLSAFDFLAGEDIEFVLNSEPVLLARAPASALGAAAVRSIVIPADTTPGMHTIVATGRTSGRTASVTIEVLPAAAQGAPESAAPASRTAPEAPAATGLAETGNESLALLGLAGSLALIGAGMVGLRRRTAII